MTTLQDPSEAPSPSTSRKRLIRQSGFTSIAALGSVLAGLLLSVAIAATFGAGHRTDAFFVGSRIPLGLVALIIAAANQTLVPAFSTWFVKRDANDAVSAISRVFMATVAAGVVLAIVGAAISTPLVEITAPGLNAATLHQAAGISRIMFFVVPLTAAAEIIRSLLNARYAFVAPAAMNILMSAIAAGLVLAMGGRGITIVAWGYLAGAVGQLVFMIVLARRHGFRPRSALHLRDPDIVMVAKLSRRPLLGASLNPVARIGEQVVASYLPVGSISVLGYSMTLVNAIGGTVFFRSVMVALLPRLTEAGAAGRKKEMSNLTSLGLKIMLALALPLTVFMALLAKPGVRAIFGRGNFSGHSAALLGLLLAVYSSSMIGSAIQRALLAPFYAELDTRTPLRNTFYGVLANMALLPICVLFWGFGSADGVLGVAVAYSVSQYVNVGHAAFRLRGRLPPGWGIPFGWVVRLTVASLAAAEAIAVLTRVTHLDGPASRWVLLAKTAAVGAVGLVVLGVLIALLVAGDLKRMRRDLARKRR